MKWNKAIRMIEEALAENKEVEIKYHRKWNRNENEVRWSMVSHVSEYTDIKSGTVCKAVHTPFYLLDEGNWIIEEINIEDRK